ncbi:hypothetical protein ACFV5G_26255, partial [Streptomyces sp. NPDC059766]
RGAARRGGPPPPPPPGLVVELFGTLGRARRDEVVAEGERLLALMHPEGAGGVRFGTVVPG